MFLQRAIKISVVVTTRVVLLLALPSTVVCQGVPIQAEEPPMFMEEVIVLGSRSLVDLKREKYRAEEALYNIFNSFNADDDFDIHCHKEAPTGSHIKRRVCKPNFVGKLLAAETQNMMRGEPFVYPTARIKQMNERLLTSMAETALEQPAMLEAIISLTQARQTLESERKRRCEGRIFFCRRQ